MSEKHEFMPGGRHVDHVPEENCCIHCGSGAEHQNHKNEDGSDYYDTDTIFDRMRADGSVAPRVGR